MEVASPVEESPSCATVEDEQPEENQDNVDICTERQETTPQASPAKTNSGRGRPPKTTPLSAQKTTPVEKEGGSDEQDAPGFQDDPSDTDYTPSKSLLRETKCASET